MKKIIKMNDKKIKFTLDIGDCEVDIIVRRVRDPKPTVHIEDIPVDCRRNPINTIANLLIFLAMLLVLTLFMMLIVLFI